MSNNTQIQHNKGKWLLLLISSLCFLLLALLMLLSGNSGGQAYAQSELLVIQNAKVEVLPVRIQENYLRQRIVYGRVESAKRSDVGFELSGSLQSLDVSEGETVQQGQALASLDVSRLNARENELIAALNRAQADARLAQISLQRVSELVKAKLAPQQGLDEAKATLEAAQAFVSEVDARLESLRVEKQKSTLIAPFDAQVITQLIDQGTVVNIGEPVFTLISITNLEARFGLPENIAFGLSIGEQHQISLGETRFVGTVQSIAKQRTLATRTIDAVFSIDREGLLPEQLMALVSGDLVSISVELNVDKKGAWIPLSALSNGVRGLWTVLVYDSNEGKLLARTVAVEHLDAERAFVSGAIRQGELVVVNGTHRFTPGQAVNQVEQIDALDIASISKKGL